MVVPVQQDKTPPTTDELDHLSWIGFLFFFTFPVNQPTASFHEPKNQPAWNQRLGLFQQVVPLINGHVDVVNRSDNLNDGFAASNLSYF